MTTTDTACGEYRGYMRHWKAGEKACQDCLAAKRAYASARRVSRSKLPAAHAEAAALGLDLCSWPRCMNIGDDDGWCGSHAPDESAVLRAMQGDRVDLFPHERTEAVRRLRSQGLTYAEVARVLRVTLRTVERHVAKVRAA